MESSYVIYSVFIYDSALCPIKTISLFTTFTALFVVTLIITFDVLIVTPVSEVKPVLKLHNDDVTPPLSIVTDAGVNVKPVHLGVSVTEPLNGAVSVKK